MTIYLLAYPHPTLTLIAINVDGIVAFGFAASGPNLLAGASVCNYTVRDDVLDPLSTVRDGQVDSPVTSSYFLDYGFEEPLGR